MTAQPQPDHMSDACPLCGASIVADDVRCPDCGYTLDGVGARGPGYTRAALLWTIGAFLAIYLITVAIVAATQ